MIGAPPGLGTWGGGFMRTGSRCVSWRKGKGCPRAAHVIPAGEPKVRPHSLQNPACGGRGTHNVRIRGTIVVSVRAATRRATSHWQGRHAANRTRARKGDARSGCVRGPFRVFGIGAREDRIICRPRVLSEFAARSEFLVRRSIARIGLSDPAMPFAISPAVRFSVRRTASATVKRLTRPLFEFRVPPESSTPVPSQSAAAGRHLSWAFGPFSTCEARRSTVCGRRHASATFRPQGLATLSAVLRPPSPGRAYLIPAALVGLALRSFLLAEGTRGVSARVGPPAVSPVGIPAARGGGPAQRAAASGF